MQIEVFCLCKAAPVNSVNQPTIVDIFDTKMGLGEPVMVESFLLAVSLRWYRTDEGQHSFRVTCADEAGTILLGPIIDIVSFSQLVTDSTTFFNTYVAPSALLPFGKYVFSIEVDGRQLAHTPLYVSLGTIAGHR